MGQDSDEEVKSPNVVTKAAEWSARHGLTRSQREALKASGMKSSAIDRTEVSMMQGAATMADGAAVGNGSTTGNGHITSIDQPYNGEISEMSETTHSRHPQADGTVKYIRAAPAISLPDNATSKSAPSRPANRPNNSRQLSVISHAGEPAPVHRDPTNPDYLQTNADGQNHGVSYLKSFRTPSNLLLLSD